MSVGGSPHVLWFRHVNQGGLGCEGGLRLFWAGPCQSPRALDLEMSIRRVCVCVCACVRACMHACVTHS